MKIGDKTEFENPQRIVRIVASNPVEKQGFVRISVRQLTGKDSGLFYVESFTKSKVSCADIADYCEENLFVKFRQVLVSTDNADITYLSNGKGNVKRLVKKAVNKQKDEGQNKKKNYILTEGMPVLPLVDLGVFTKDFKVVNSMYDKYRQINRFVEILDDKFAEVKEPLTVLDFGCGKSYLTFAMYYYLRELEGFDVNIIGLDLKEDVIDFCSGVASDLGCDGLKFLKGDIADYTDDHADMVVTLHACDTATDYALINAVAWNTKVILSVPCCQHELFKQIKNDLHKPILKHGILKDRFTEYLTDGLRGLKLESCGYDVAMIEFTSLEHTARNIMIKAVKTNAAGAYAKKKREAAEQQYRALCDFYQVAPTIGRLGG